MKEQDDMHNQQQLPILIVDDDAGQRSLLETVLAKEGFTILTASSGEEALSILDKKEIGMMISDVRMPGISGLEALREARHIHADLSVLMITAYPDIRDAVLAMQDGAVNYLEKPIDLDELIESVRHFYGLTPERQSGITEKILLPDNIVAESPQMLEVLREATFVASSESRILITGESGVGKEVVADLIHTRSRRAAGPLIKVNCAAIPDTLLESELFGHEKGAFTGAINRRIGRFEVANEGTILLDEIGVMSPSLQAKLLRITQDGTFQRIGSNVLLSTNARILASTNQNLDDAVAGGTFREDLFYRLNVFEIFVPPLRERLDDIIPLAHFFAASFSKESPRFSSSVLLLLKQYSWPGNVRELRNAMERATLMARGGIILPEHLPRRIQKGIVETELPCQEPSPSQRIDDMERMVILQALRENNYNRTLTARNLGISRRALLYKLKRFRAAGYNIEPENS